ncbi:N-acetylmuramoyl-L-alanine amidase [Solibacillus sp. CAU 1738]|uniref:N-acetylmuramoyl-L-alanine amidase n=1 Tax=Solibacillus sp. CAU 1738 TaxID=3140363 RepID=UPI003260D9E4
MYLKKFSLLLVIVIMSMFSIHNVYASQRFADVPSSHGAYEEINYLVDLGVIKGYTENGKTIFKPNAFVTRGQAAKMVIESTNNEPLIVSKSSFSDVQVGTELSGYVESAIKLGYFTEYSPGKFGPNVPLTRYEMSKILSKAFQLNEDEYSKLALPFTDVKPSDPYYKYISAIYYNGITKGDTTGTKYNAKEAVKRSQFASFIARASNEKYRLDLPVQGGTIPDTKDAIGQVRATTDDLNVRSTPDSSSSSNIIGKVKTGEKFALFEIQPSGWLKVAYEGRYAYVYRDYVQYVDENGQKLGKVQKHVKASGNISMYKTRDINGKVIGSFAADTTINVYSTIGNWYLADINGLPGYVRISQTTEIVEEQPTPPDNSVEEKPEEPQLKTKTIGSATVNGLHIREKASGSSKSLGKIDRGTLVEVHSISGNWAKITYNGINGYIHKTYLRLKNQTGSPIAGRIIIVDAGHGGTDPGTASGNAIEKEITLNVATLVKKKLEKAGAIVKMTRTGDTYPTLSDRVSFAQKNYGEMFVSVHVNSASSSAKGTETYYSVSNNTNEKEDYALATAINNQIVKNANMKNRGVKREDYFVIKGLVMPAVLVELGFATNPEDRDKLTSDKYVDIFAQSIYNGIVEYYRK